ncbi:MAG: aspartyl protease family protein [Phycisphaerae bacterium]
MTLFHYVGKIDFMGHSWIDIEISDLERKHSKKVQALVETGASLTTLPKKIADELGIKPTRQEQVSTGAGLIKVSRGRAWIKLKGKEDAFAIWISDVIDKVLLGVVVLESFGFKVDPTTGTLEEKPLLLY